MDKDINRHSHNHEHDHGHSHLGHDHSQSYKKIGVAFLLNLFFSVVEIVGGVITNSIAIISDAVHDLGDAVSLGVSWGLEKYSKKSPDKKYTYGYARFSLLAALINSLVLVAGAVFVLFSAIPRILNPEEVNPEGMILFAIVGIVINGLAVFVVSKGKSFNEKTVSWHLLEDVFGWIVVLITSILMLFINAPILDPIISVAITVFILYKVIRNLMAIFKVFLEGAPDDVKDEDIANIIVEETTAIACHHIHIWTLDGINHFLTAHIIVADNADDNEIISIKKDVRKVLERLNIKHVTLEIEFKSEVCENDNC